MESTLVGQTASRRSKRRASVISPVKPTFNVDSTVTTPSRKRVSKRVRFSGSDVPPTTSAFAGDTTGLTPAVGRATLSTPKSKRPATPARTAVPVGPSPVSEIDYIQFTPLRQALDERCQRRIRRNHLSEELNSYESDKRMNSHLRSEIAEKNIELKRLKAELRGAKTSEEERQSSEVPNAATQSRVVEVEEELNALRRSFGLSDSAPQIDENWNCIPRGGNGPRSEGGDTIQIYEDDTDPHQQQPNEDVDANLDNQGDALLMGLELESARQAKQSMLSSFSRNNRSFDTSLNFADSPARPSKTSQSAISPATPRTLYHNLSKQLKAATSRAEDAELALTALEGEVRALGFSQAADTPASTCLTILADHFRSIRLELERLMPGETTISFENAELFPELIRKLKGVFRQLNSREAELRTLRTQERNLRGNFDHALVAADKTGLKIKDLEKALDEIAGESMDTRMRAQELERQRDSKERDVEKLQAALDKYREEVSRLEELISKVEGDHQDAMQKVKKESATAWERVEVMEAKVMAEETGRRKAEESAVGRLKRIQDLEESLTRVRENAEQVQNRLKSFEQRDSTHNDEVGGLNSRISGLATALEAANAEVEKLRLANTRLEQQYRNEVAQGEKAVARMQEHLIKAATKITEAGKGWRRGSKVRLANWELESDDTQMDETGAPMTPASIVRFADMEEDDDGARAGDNDDDDHVPGSVEMGRGKNYNPQPLTPAMDVRKMSKGRRRYDSGIGMSPLTQSEDEGEGDNGFMTPELSSDGDVDLDEGEAMEFASIKG